MTRWMYHGMIQSNLWVGGTGLVYGLMRYVLKTSDPYAVVNHPWQPYVQHLHIVTAPALVFFLGIFWAVHAAPYLRADEKEGRKSGMSMLWLAGPMVLSGYLLQVSVHQTWHMVWVVLHILSSVLWVAAFLFHWWVHFSTRLKDRTKKQAL